MCSSPQTLRILHCANFSEYKYGAPFYATDRKISNGLIRNGHLVFDFSHRDVARKEGILNTKRLGITKMNNRLLQAADQVQPDILLLGHAELVAHKTLERFRARFPKAKIAMWWVDWIVEFNRNKAFFKKRIEEVDHFFLTTDPVELTRMFAIEKPADQLHFLPNICDRCIDTGQAFANDSYDHDLIYAGRLDPARSEMIDFIQQKFSHLQVGVFGQRKENLVLGQQYIALLSNTKMAINFSRSNNYSRYSSDRMVHLAANGTLVLSPRIPNMETVFSNQEVAYFEDWNELEALVNHYMVHDAERRETAQAGWKRAHQDYDSTVVTQTMLATLNDGSG